MAARRRWIGFKSILISGVSRDLVKALGEGNGGQIQEYPVMAMYVHRAPALRGLGSYPQDPSLGGGCRMSQGCEWPELASFEEAR